MLDCFFWKKIKKVFFVGVTLHAFWGDFACFRVTFKVLVWQGGLYIRSLTTPQDYSWNLFILNNFRDINKNWCPNLPFWVVKMGQKCVKRGKITIFSKLIELGCWFLFVSPHFPTHWVHLKWFPTFPIIGYPKCWA